MLPDSSKSLVSCCGYNMGMIKWTGNDLLTSKTIKIYILPKPYTGISCADWSRAMADKSTGRENDVVNKGKDHEKLFSTWLNIQNIKMHSSHPGLSP